MKAVPKAIASDTLGVMSIKAEPEVMVQKAQAITGSLKRIRQEYEDMSRAMTRTAGYWNGEAAELYRAQYRNKQPLVEDMFKRIAEHAADLQSIAEVYVQAETKVTAAAAVLPKDAIK